MMTLLPLLLFIFTICLLAAFIALQIYLSRKPSKWPGRILPIAGFTVAVLVSQTFRMELLQNVRWSFQTAGNSLAATKRSITKRILKISQMETSPESP